MEGVMAVVTCFAADFAPKNWALCNGQLMAIAQNQALFALIGTTYGGNGVQTFALPDLRGRTAVSQGQLIGGSSYTLGEKTGTESVTLNMNNLPVHAHTGNIVLMQDADNNDGSVTRAINTFPAVSPNGYAPLSSAKDTMLLPDYQVTVGNAGSSQPVPTLMPYLAVNYIICLYGIFPSRN